MHDTALLKNLYELLAGGKLDRPKFFQMLARAVVQEIGCSRASIWFYAGPLQDQAVCESLYDAGDNQWASGIVLSEDDFAPYFEAMRSDKMIIASQARSHPATSCFNEGYFEPLNIYSLLDVGIEVGGSPIGLVCCEQTGGEKEWSQPDVQYLQQVGAMVGLALKKLG
ncbi:GAF domain-containing protein [Chitinimonas sp. BJYL2]|uniref:GAF domain-containing protein n=1 Tax=Chitinimonas sp. BJYL2 TaxID=2976696 RepID=UPI0022B58668|nr:GAF domain-containing protein [Chitinimonas sp. BJYL2]